MRSLHESDLAVAKFEQMLQRQLSRTTMVENNIRDAFQRAVARDSDRGQRHGFTKQSVHGNQSLNSALQKNMRIAVQQFLIVVMRDREKEKAVLPQVAFNAADNHRCVRIAQITRDHADSVGALHAQRAR
jgi:hypothetical protein